MVLPKKNKKCLPEEFRLGMVGEKQSRLMKNCIDWKSDPIDRFDLIQSVCFGSDVLKQKIS
jgi:hypothetical protein